MLFDKFTQWNDPIITGDMTTVANRLRQSDLDEIRADNPDADPYDIIERSVKGSQLRYAVVNRQCFRRPMGIWGIGAELVRNYDYFPIWLLGTDELTEKTNAIEFVRLTQQFLPYLKSVYGSLGNWVTETNTKTLKWLHCLGFRPSRRSEARRTGITFIEMIYY